MQTLSSPSMKSNSWMTPAELHRKMPFASTVTSVNLGWGSVEAWRACHAPSSALSHSGLTHHNLVLFNHPPADLHLRFGDVARRSSPPPGSILIIPAGAEAAWRWQGTKDSLHVFLDPNLVSRVTAELFEMDSARMSVPPLDAANAPLLRSAMLAINAELMTSGIGGKLAAESLANVLAVQLIRHVASPQRNPERNDASLPRTKLAAVLEYIHANLRADLSLDELAAVAHLSPYHFARQFKTATGLPPHQYVIARRIDLARTILAQPNEIPLAQVALDVGFSDQSQFSRHFKRLAGMTPRQFKTSAGIA